MDIKFPPHLLVAVHKLRQSGVVNVNAKVLTVFGVVPDADSGTQMLCEFEASGLAERAVNSVLAGPVFRLADITLPKSTSTEESMNPGRPSVQLNLSFEERQQLAILLVHLQEEVGEFTYASPGFLGTRLGHDKFGFGAVGASRVMEKLMPTHLKRESVTSNFFWFGEHLRALVTPQAEREYLKKKHPYDKPRLSMTRAFLRTCYIRTGGERSIDPSDLRTLEIARGFTGFKVSDEASLREELVTFQLYDSSLVSQPGNKFGISRVEPEWDIALRSQQSPASVVVPSRTVPASSSKAPPPSPAKKPDPHDWERSLGSVSPVASGPPLVPPPAPAIVAPVAPPKVTSVVAPSPPPPPVVTAPDPVPVQSVEVGVAPPAPVVPFELKPPAAPASSFEACLAAVEKTCKELTLNWNNVIQVLREELSARDKMINEAQARITVLEEEVAKFKKIEPAPQLATDTPHEEVEEPLFEPTAAAPAEVMLAAAPDNNDNTNPSADSQTMTGPAEPVAVEDGGRSSLVIEEASDGPEASAKVDSQEAWYTFIKNHPSFRQWTPPTVFYLFTQGQKFKTIDMTKVWERHFGDHRKVAQIVGNWRTRFKVRTQRLGESKHLGSIVSYLAQDFQRESRLLERLTTEFKAQKAAA